jgi:hypothetical protein
MQIKQFSLLVVAAVLAGAIQANAADAGKPDAGKTDVGKTDAGKIRLAHLFDNLGKHVPPVATRIDCGIECSLTRKDCEDGVAARGPLWQCVPDRNQRGSWCIVPNPLGSCPPGY